MSKKEKCIISFAIIAVISLWLSSGFLIYTFWTPTDGIGPGTIGDMFGAINALFSGLAFAILIAALLLQGRELALQREELKLTREELARTGKANEEQAETLRLQRFENTFFSMLNVYRNAVEHINYSGLRGEIALETLCREYVQIWLKFKGDSETWIKKSMDHKSEEHGQLRIFFVIYNQMYGFARLFATIVGMVHQKINNPSQQSDYLQYFWSIIHQDQQAAYIYFGIEQQFRSETKKFLLDRVKDPKKIEDRFNYAEEFYTSMVRLRPGLGIKDPDYIF